MIRPLLRLLAGLVAVVLFAVPALAADRAIIILDASGSMWAQIDGKARIDIARETLKQVLKGVPDDLELGFMAYGHRSKGDCNDIQMLVDPAPGTAAAISAAADALNPKGKTPLSASVKMAAEQLKYTEDKATVILITDGIETCNADPCALASELKKDGVDFKVDVVGLALNDDEANQVKCIADNTDGKYITANDETALQNALTDVVSDVTAPTPPPAEPSSSQEQVADNGVNFAPVVTLAKGGKPIKEDGVDFEFHSINDDGTPGDDKADQYGTAPATIDPGDYIVIAKLDYATAQQKVTIANGTVAKPVFDMEAGMVDMRPLAEAGGKPVDSAEYDLTFPDGTTDTGYGEVKKHFPAGDSQLKVTIGTGSVSDTISVVAGKSQSKDELVGIGHVTFTGSYAAGSPVTDSTLLVDIFDAKKDIQGDRTEITSGYGPTVDLDLAPGDYVAVATYDAAKVEQPFSVKAATTQAIDINLNAGVLALTAPTGYYSEVFSALKDLQGNRTSFGGTYDMTATRTLSAGDYHLVVTLADQTTTKEADVTIKAGQRTEITVQ